jgi:hypothetical protein
MTDFTIRQALLDDAEPISQLFRARISVWQRLDARGQVENLPQEQLNVYERWTHGGPWMTVETAAVLLGRLLRGAGLPLVVEVDGRVIGYAETYPGNEPEPFQRHLHIAHLITAPESDTDSEPAAVQDVLIEALKESARALDRPRLTVSLSGPGDERAELYKRHGFGSLQKVQRCILPARIGQGFYKINPHSSADPAQIKGWGMVIGRSESARQHWENEWARTWEVIPEIEAQRTDRMQIIASGQESFFWCRRQLYNSRAADIYCWSPRPLTAQLLTAIRDWTYRQDYRTLSMIVGPDAAKVLGPDAETVPFTREIYSVEV